MMTDHDDINKRTAFDISSGATAGVISGGAMALGVYSAQEDEIRKITQDIKTTYEKTFPATLSDAMQGKFNFEAMEISNKASEYKRNVLDPKIKNAPAVTVTSFILTAAGVGLAVMEATHFLRTRFFTEKFSDTPSTEVETKELRRQLKTLDTSAPFARHK